MVRTLVYIAGFNYSGSTLLSLMLKEHSTIGTLGELCGPPHFSPESDFQCSCGVCIRECSFFRRLEKRVDHPRFMPCSGVWRTSAVAHSFRLRERLLHGTCRCRSIAVWRDLVRDRVLFPLGACRDLVEANARLVAGACDLLEVETLVDSSKVPAQLSILSRIPELRLKVLHLVRHPGGSCCSAMRYHGYAAKDAARIWRGNYQACSHQARVLPPSALLRVRYEDLCSNAERTLETICGFIGLSYEGEMRKLCKTGTHIVGNRMRLAADTAIAADETWRIRLSGQQVADIETICAREMRECGYA